MTITKQYEQFGEILIPRDRAAAQLIAKLEAERRLPLISIHGPSGVGKSDLAGPVLVEELKALSGKSNPKLLKVHITSHDSSMDVALRITDLILDNHSEFRSRRAATIFRDKISRSVKRSPGEAAERLRTMMRNTEKGKFDIKKIQLVICLDGVDKLFENKARSGADLSKAAICGEANDPVGFLNKLVGMNTILFTMVNRSWVSRDVRTILGSGRIDNERRIDFYLSYPDPEEVEAIVAKMLAPIREQSNNKEEIDEYRDLLTSSIRENPALIGAIPATIYRMFGDRDGGLTRTERCVERYHENHGMLGELVKKADEIYLEQNTNNKLALEEVFSNLIKGGGRLLIKDAVMSDELWTIALKFVENRILAIDGRSHRDARFITTHKGLLSTWNRAVEWTGGKKRSLGITQLRNLDDRALSWQLAERSKTLLINSEEKMADARLVLKDSELSSQLSPLTREYLNQSLKPKRDVKKVLLSKKIWIPIGSFVGLLFILAVIIVVIPDPGAPKIATVPKEPEPVVTVAPAPQPAVELIPIVAEVPAPQAFWDKIDNTLPQANELLASATKISTYESSEEAPVVEDADLMTESEPLLSDLDLIAHVDQVRKMTPSNQHIPIGLPSAQAHFQKSISQINKNAIAASKKEPVTKTSPGTEKTKVIEFIPNDSDRLYNGLTNGRLEVGGAENQVTKISEDSSWREILNSMGADIAKNNIDNVLDSLRIFHEKTVNYPDEIKNIQVSEFKDLTSHLGKVALLQQDRVAIQGAWKLELVSQNVVEINTNLRMLMARIACNGGRDTEAVAYLAQTKIQDDINEASVGFMKAAIGWHFNEEGEAAANFRKLLPPQVSAY